MREANRHPFPRTGHPVRRNYAAEVKRPKGWKLAVLIAGGIGWALPVHAADDPIPKVVLPKVEVNAPVVREREKWRYGQVAGWEVYSQIADRKSRVLLES